MTLVERVLAQRFPDRDWCITRPAAGAQKETYLVQSSQHKFVVKFDAANAAWPRLAELGVTPPLVSTGVYEERSYLIQQFAEGSHPDRAWFAQNVATLARFVRRYHDDPPLTELLSGGRQLSHEEHIAQEVAALAAAVATASDPFHTDPFRRVFDTFQRAAKYLPPAPLVPTHADPSPVNFIVHESDLTMIDWDEVSLSDPLRDIGPMLWWYLPQTRWQPFFDAYGAPLDRDRLFWWTARRSLQVALWLDARSAVEMSQAFLADFYRAAQRQPNPQAA